jgi:hypothetical protein
MQKIIQYTQPAHMKISTVKNVHIGYVVPYQSLDHVHTVYIFYMTWQCIPFVE